MLRPHVHGDALGAAVAHLEDLPRFDVHAGYCIGEWASAGGLSGSTGERILFSCARSAPRVCGRYPLVHSSFFASSPRRRSRSLRLSKAQRWTTWLSVPNSVNQKPSSLPYLSPRIFRPISAEFLRYWACIPGCSV